MPRINIEVCKNDLPNIPTFSDGMVAVDTETLGLNVTRDRLCVCQLGDGQGNVWLVQFDGTDYSAPNLKQVLSDPRLLKIFHYARFDMATLKHYLEVDVNPVFCTKIASKLTRTYSDRHGLKTIVEEICGEVMDKSAQSSDWSAERLTEEQKYYAASDVIYLHELKKAFDEKLQSVGRLAWADQCFKFLPTRVALDIAGWENSDIFSHNG